MNANSILDVDVASWDSAEGTVEDLRDELSEHFGVDFEIFVRSSTGVSEIRSDSKSIDLIPAGKVGMIVACDPDSRVLITRMNKRALRVLDGEGWIWNAQVSTENERLNLSDIAVEGTLREALQAIKDDCQRKLFDRLLSVGQVDLLQLKGKTTAEEITGAMERCFLPTACMPCDSMFDVDWVQFKPNFYRGSISSVRKTDASEALRLTLPSYRTSTQFNFSLTYRFDSPLTPFEFHAEWDKSAIKPSFVQKAVNISRQTPAAQRIQRQRSINTLHGTSITKKGNDLHGVVSETIGEIAFVLSGIHSSVGSILKG
jgi:hypothetical protein